ncbi:hypothetical protein BaRGS_00038360 [Batillaria attramentaria]|uniref:Uncharacterized protein n=1 Tax=Batillaria attramentaria TaxID=370345 RepID=A0ABD0J5Z9_9CAEN
MNVSLMFQKHSTTSACHIRKSSNAGCETFGRKLRMSARGRMNIVKEVGKAKTHPRHPVQQAQWVERANQHARTPTRNVNVNNKGVGTTWNVDNKAGEQQGKWSGVWITASKNCKKHKHFPPREKKNKYHVIALSACSLRPESKDPT